MTTFSSGTIHHLNTYFLLFFPARYEQLIFLINLIVKNLGSLEGESSQGYLIAQNPKLN